MWVPVQCGHLWQGHVRVFNPLAQSNSTKTVTGMYKQHDAQKKREYNLQVIRVEHGSFTPLVFSTSGGLGPEADQFLKHIAVRRTLNRLRMRVSKHHLNSPCTLISHPNPNPNPNPYSNHIPNPNPNPNPNSNSNLTEKWSFFSCLTEHWSRDHLKISFSPITPQGCIFTLRHGGDSESASKNTSIPIFLL